MKIVLAPDKFKGSLSGIEFCDITAEAILSIMPNAEIIKMPLSDGGDGTIDILDYHLEGQRIKLKVTDPLFRQIEVSYLYISSSSTAFIEMAAASGMALLKAEEQNCYNTTTFGTGELIKDAIERGAKTIVLGIGGSATNDCGIGMAAALGYRFLDKKSVEIVPIGKNLIDIDKIDDSNVNVGLSKITFKVACDVTNPLYGHEGAAYVFGPQKGASKKEVDLLNIGLEHIAKVILNQFNIDLQKIKGTGAAGGMGGGSLVFLNANLFSGIDLVKELVDFDNKIKDANWIITGEGKLDSQTFSGKTISGVLVSGKRYKIPIAVFCGSITLSESVLKEYGVLYAAAILDIAKDVNDAIKNSRIYLKKIAEKFTLHIKEL